MGITINIDTLLIQNERPGRPASLEVLSSAFESGTRGPGRIRVAADGRHLPDGDATPHVAVFDEATGLLWAINSIGKSDDEGMSQEDCAKACAALDLLGHRDWRLPTRIELAALVDDTRCEPAIDTVLFPGVKPRWHWTSTAVAWSSASAWYVSFSGGSVNSLRRGSSGFALAVRRAGQSSAL